MASFTWHDVFQPEQQVSQQNIHLEKAAILFNLGAMCLEIGLGFDRNSVIGRRDSCQKFISAASFLAYLRDNESSKASVTVKCAGMLEHCCSHKSRNVFPKFFVNPTTTNVVCARIASQVTVYYVEALKALNSPFLKDHFDERWKNNVQLKAALFYAEACVRHEENDTSGKAARLHYGLSRLTEARNLSNECDPLLIKLVDQLVSRVKSNLEKISNDENKEIMPSLMLDIPPFSVIMILREQLDAIYEKLFAYCSPVLVQKQYFSVQFL